MAVVERDRKPAPATAVEVHPHAAKVGPIGRLGRYTATHFRLVLAAWVVVALGLGFLAPKVETALSGAGWETSGSQSVQARQLVDKNFHGLSSYALMTVVYSPTRTFNTSAFKKVVAASSARSGPTAPSRASYRRRRAYRSPAMGTQRSCRQVPRAAPTGWSRPPTRSRESSQRSRPRTCRST